MKKDIYGVSCGFRLQEESVSVKDMIEALQQLNPNDRLFVGEEGVYSNFFAAATFLPDYSENSPASKYKTVEGGKYYCIGYSCQDGYC